ncbi:unnamed protein product, partial [Didymodactylos carnosus]
MAVLWASRVTYLLILIFNLSTWIDLIGIWTELPLIVAHLPEGWTLPSIISMITCLSNIYPLIIIVIRCIRGSKNFSEIPHIYAVIFIGIGGCMVLGLFWHKTFYLFHQQRSVIFLVATFFLSMLDCSSSLIYFDYMKRFRPKYLNAMFFGEGLTGLIPALIAFAQGIGGEITCESGHKPSYSRPRFSVKIYFFILAALITCSLFAFILLQWTSIAQSGDALEKRDETMIIEDQNVKQ